MLQSRPPPPGSAAHRRLEAERRYSSSQRHRRSRKQGDPRPRCVCEFPSLLKIGFYSYERFSILKEPGGTCESGYKKKTGALRTSCCILPLLSISSLLLLCLCAFKRLPAPSSRIRPSDLLLIANRELPFFFCRSLNHISVLLEVYRLQP